MARSREPTKENAKKLYEEGFGSLSQIAKELNLSLNTLKSWRTRDKKEGKEWVQKGAPKSAPDTRVQPSRKAKLKEAKSIVVNGGTIKEASEKTGIKESTLMNHSVRENWMSKQKDYLERLYGRLRDERGQEHIQRRLESIDFLNWIQKKSMNLGTSLSPTALDDSLKGYQRLANIVKTTITAQAELLGISGVEELINGYDRSIIHTFRQEELQIKLLEADLKRERNQIEREKYNGGYVSKASLEEEDLIKEVGKGYRKFIKSKKLYNYLKGARGSKKSKTIALRYIYNLLNNPTANLLVVRQVDRTNRTSTFTDLKWAARKLGVYEQFKFNVSPLEITVIGTGQKIYFRGMNDPLSITSISVEHGVLSWVWIEEAYQIRSEDDWNKVEMSIRGQLEEGMWKEFIFSFNPWSSRHWLNAKGFRGIADNDEVLEEEGEFINYEDDLTLAMTTSYKINEFLDNTDKIRYEKMKEDNPERYKVEGLGLWGIIEGLIFHEGRHWTVEKFDYNNFEANNGKYQRAGGDFGFNDPTAFYKVHVDDFNKKIYIWNEYYERYKTTDDLKIELESFKECSIVGDSSAKGTIKSLYNAGYNIESSIKGKESVVDGIRFLQSYKVIIHPECPNLIDEATLYCWEIKDDSSIDKPKDMNNHGWDAVRYAVEDLYIDVKNVGVSKRR